MNRTNIFQMGPLIKWQFWWCYWCTLLSWLSFWLHISLLRLRFLQLLWPILLHNDLIYNLAFFCFISLARLDSSWKFKFVVFIRQIVWQSWRKNVILSFEYLIVEFLIPLAEGWLDFSSSLLLNFQRLIRLRNFFLELIFVHQQAVICHFCIYFVPGLILLICFFVKKIRSFCQSISLIVLLLNHENFLVQLGVDIVEFFGKRFVRLERSGLAFWFWFG